MLKIWPIEQRSEDWYKIRANLVTASNAGRLLSSGKDKALEPRSSGTGRAAERGLTLEPEAIELYEVIKGVKVDRPGFITNTDYPIAGASPDGIVDDTLIEVKCFGNNKHLDINKDNIPFEVIAQVQFSMMVCDLQNCDLVLYNPDVEDLKNAMKIIRIERDEDIIKNIKKKL